MSSWIEGCGVKAQLEFPPGSAVQRCVPVSPYRARCWDGRVFVGRVLSTTPCGQALGGAGGAGRHCGLS